MSALRDNDYLKRRARFIRNHVRKATGKKIDFTASHVGRIYSIYDSCLYCGSKKNLVIDHIVPISRGGETTFDNLALACSRCNDDKCGKLISEWLNPLELAKVRKRMIKGQTTL